VRVTDAVGVIAIPGLQITVKPKIPLPHLLVMFARAGVWPRLDDQRTAIEHSADLLELITLWFLSATERLLRLGLIRDYGAVCQEEPIVRGRLELLPTAKLYYSGRAAFECEYEEFTFDTPLNRLIRAAALAIAATTLVRRDVRARALRVVARVEEAGDLRSNDLAANVDRRTAHYRDPALLARALIQHVGRTPLAGGHTGWTFLIRTPEVVENALRSYLAEAMQESVRRAGLQLKGTALTLNPDLVFGPPSAIGDVKYKLSSGDWNRADLYQLVAFATGFRVDHALLVQFRQPNVPGCPDLFVGGVRVSERTWPSDPLIPGYTAAAQFVDGVRDWMDLRSGPPQGRA
jgi:5-methylcytosine-specific restriction enzyme subunit McrC